MSGPSLLLLLLVGVVGAAHAGLHMQHCKRSLRQTWFESCGGLANPSQLLDSDDGYRRRRQLDTRPDVPPNLLQRSRSGPKFDMTDEEVRKFNHVFERMTRSPDTFSDCCRNLDRCLKEKPFPCV